jgi:hypothetical protein
MKLVFYGYTSIIIFDVYVKDTILPKLPVTNADMTFHRGMDHSLNIAHRKLLDSRQRSWSRHMLRVVRLRVRFLMRSLKFAICNCNYCE